MRPDFDKHINRQPWGRLEYDRNTGWPCANFLTTIQTTCRFFVIWTQKTCRNLLKKICRISHKHPNKLAEFLWYGPRKTCRIFPVSTKNNLPVFRWASGETCRIVVSGVRRFFRRISKNMWFLGVRFFGPILFEGKMSVLKNETTIS